MTDEGYVPIPYDLDAMTAKVARRAGPDGTVDPRSRPEWQYAADLAELALILHAAREFGLVAGGPVVVVERCDAIIAAARLMGIDPAPSAELLDRFLAELTAPVDAGAAPG